MAEEEEVADVTALLDLSKKKKKKKSKKKESSGTGGGDGGGGDEGKPGGGTTGGTGLSPEAMEAQQKMLLEQDAAQEIDDAGDTKAN